MKYAQVRINVKRGPLCWDDNSPCDHFENEGGWSRCLLFRQDLPDDDERGYPYKLTDCRIATINPGKY